MKEITYHLPIRFNGSIIDIETSGLDEKIHEITCCGILSGDIIRQYYQEKPIGLDINELVYELLQYPSPSHAFNKNMEERFLRINIDIEIQKPNGFGRYIPKHEIITIAPFMSGDILDGIGSKCVDLWKIYKETNDFADLNVILRHNKSCLLQELILVIYQNAVLK